MSEERASKVVGKTMDDQNQFEAIYGVVRAIPPGRVMSYGQVGAEIGCPPRTVGWALATDMEDDVPWQRVVGADGYLRIGRRSVALMEKQRELLTQEGVTFRENGCVDMARHQVNEHTQRRKHRDQDDEDADD